MTALDIGIVEKAPAYSVEPIADFLTKLRFLAARCDGAHSLDDAGLQQVRLTVRQAPGEPSLLNQQPGQGGRRLVP